MKTSVSLGLTSFLLTAVVIFSCEVNADEVRIKIEKAASEYKPLVALYRKNGGYQNISKENRELRTKIGEAGRVLVGLLLAQGVSEKDLLSFMGEPSSKMYPPDYVQKNNKQIYMYYGVEDGWYIFVTCKNGKIHEWSETVVSYR